MSKMLAFKKKEALLKKQIDEIYVLLKDNDIISVKFKQKGKNVVKAREFIKKSKEITDKINNQILTKRMNETLIKKALLEIE